MDIVVNINEILGRAKTFEARERGGGADKKGTTTVGGKGPLYSGLSSLKLKSMCTLDSRIPL